MKLHTMESYLFGFYLQSRCMSVFTVNVYRCAARQFDTFAGRVRQLDQRHLDRFYKWLTNRSYTKISARNYCNCASAIAREWFPCGPWRQKRSVFLNADMPGTLDNAFARGFSQRRKRPVTDAETRRRYGSTLLLFSNHLGRPAMLSDLTGRRVAAFVAWLAKHCKAAEWTVANHAQRIGSLWRWAWRNGLVENAPTWRAN